MDTCEYCDGELALRAVAPTPDPRTDEISLACEGCGHVVTLEVRAGDRPGALAA